MPALVSGPGVSWSALGVTRTALNRVETASDGDRDDGIRVGDERVERGAR